MTDEQKPKKIKKVSKTLEKPLGMGLMEVMKAKEMNREQFVMKKLREVHLAAAERTTMRVIEKDQEDQGLTPMEVMLENMRYYAKQYIGLEGEGDKTGRGLQGARRRSGAESRAVLPPPPCHHCSENDGDKNRDL
jgi:acetoin utilization deacetylase AcuC-like enzyme